MANVPGRRRIEVVLSFREQRVVRGQVPKRPVDGWREDVDVVLEYMREGPALSPLNLQVRNLGKEVLEGTSKPELDVLEAVLNERTVEAQCKLKSREICEVEGDANATVPGE